METNTALLIMDMQDPMVKMIPNADAVVKANARALAFARSKNIPVIYVVVGFREGAPEICSRNKGFAAARQRFASVSSADFTNIYHEVAPLPGEVTVTKRRVSAFTGSDLEVLLRAYGAYNIVLTGIATSGVVLSTTREAADKDYSITILSDCCADGDEEVHRVLLTKVLPRQAEVMTVEDWEKSMG